jgi:hypothetical protein
VRPGLAHHQPASSSAFSAAMALRLLVLPPKDCLHMGQALSEPPEPLLNHLATHSAWKALPQLAHLERGMQWLPAATTLKQMGQGSTPSSSLAAAVAKSHTAVVRCAAVREFCWA